MRPAEELRFLILALQREGNRLLAAELRPLNVTPSQAEALRVLADHEPLTLAGLGELLVCETGGSPSRLTDRLVALKLIHREPHPDDRRHVVLTLTEDGRRMAAEIEGIEQRLYATIDKHTEGVPVQAAIEVLRAFAADFPAGQAVARRRDARAVADS